MRIMNKILTDRQTDRHALDIAKFIMAILVVAIHTGPFEYCKYPIRRLFITITELAVPFFFVVSAFLLFKKADWKLRLVRYMKRMCRLYVVWNMVYLPISIFGFMYNGATIKTALLQFARGFFLIGQQYYSWHLWYVLALIYVAMIFCLFNKTNVYVRYYVSLVLFGIGAVISAIITDGTDVVAFSVIIRLVQQTIANGRLFMGIGYFGLGMLIADREIAFNKMFLIATILGCLVLSYIVPYSIIVFVLRYVTVFCLFLLVVQTKLPMSDLYIKLRQSSTVVYFIHMFLFFGWSAIKNFQDVNGIDAFVMVASVAVITSFLLNIHKGNKRYDEIYNIFFG